MDEESKKYIENLPKTDQPPVGTTSVDTSTVGFELYSRTDYLSVSQGIITGNWVKSFSGACIESIPNNSIQVTSILKIEDSGACASGKRVTYVNVK